MLLADILDDEVLNFLKEHFCLLFGAVVFFLGYVLHSMTKLEGDVKRILDKQWHGKKAVDEILDKQYAAKRTVDEILKNQTAAKKTVDEILENQTAAKQTVDEILENQYDDGDTDASDSE